MGVITIRPRYRVTPDLRLEVVPVTLDEIRPLLWTPPEPEGVRVRDYGQRADIYYKSWQEFRNIHRAAYYGKPIAELRDVGGAHHQQTTDTVQGSVPLVSGYFAGTLDSLKLPNHPHRIGFAPSIIIDEESEDQE
jgi:hypothetical protein